MKTNKLILLGLICLTVAMPTTAQNRNEKKERTERAVKEAIAAKQYKINVDRMQPMRGGSRNLTTNYTLEIRNDSVFSYLPYFGVAYNAPYGGGKSLNFNASITGYTTRALKKGKIQIDFKTRSDEDNYEYRLTIFPDGSTSIVSLLSGKCQTTIRFLFLPSRQKADTFVSRNQTTTGT